MERCDSVSSTHPQQGLTASSLWGVHPPHESRALTSKQRITQDAAGVQDALRMLLGRPVTKTTRHLTLRSRVHPARSHVACFLLSAHAMSCLQMELKVSVRKDIAEHQT